MIFVVPFTRTHEGESIASVLVTEADGFTDAERKVMALYGGHVAPGNATELDLSQGPQSIEVARS